MTFSQNGVLKYFFVDFLFMHSYENDYVRYMKCCWVCFCLYSICIPISPSFRIYLVEKTSLCKKPIFKPWHILCKYCLVFLLYCLCTEWNHSIDLLCFFQTLSKHTQPHFPVVPSCVWDLLSQSNFFSWSITFSLFSVLAYMKVYLFYNCVDKNDFPVHQFKVNRLTSPLRKFLY